MCVRKGEDKAITITHTIWWLAVQEAYEKQNLLLLHTHGTIIMKNNHLICKSRLFPSFLLHLLRIVFFAKEATYRFFLL